jgi:hypothetical protein
MLPDSKWRLASNDGNVKKPDEGMYLFSGNRPDLGLTVFTDKAGNSITNDAFRYTRQFVWVPIVIHFKNLMLSIYSYSYQDDIKSEVYIAKEPIP